MTKKQDKKKIVFYEIAKNQADLKIKLNYDGLTQSEFFRLMIKGYLEDDDEILKFLERHRTQNKVHSSTKRAKSAAIRKNQKQEIKKFSLDGTDIEDIFDIIAEEHPDL
jgi:hypothetical protein